MKKLIHFSVYGFIFFILFTVYSGNLFSKEYFLKELLKKRELITSVVVPCHSVHAKHLPILLEHLANQTVLPDEVVISISDSSNVDESIKSYLEEKIFPFKVRPIFSQKKVSAGGNRNIACSNAIGDILICNDADDFPHNQRIEIIKNYFSNYEIDILIHSWFSEESGMDVKFLNINDFKCYRFVDIKGKMQTHTGCPSLRKEVFKSIKWVDRFISYEDTIFINNASSKFKNTIFIHAPIYQYNNHFSSYNPLNKS